MATARHGPRVRVVPARRARVALARGGRPARVPSRRDQGPAFREHRIDRSTAAVRSTSRHADDDDPAIALIDAVAGTLHVLAWNAARLFDDGSLQRTEDRDALVDFDAAARLRLAAGARGDDARLHARQLRPGRSRRPRRSRSWAPADGCDDPEGHEGRVDPPGSRKSRRRSRPSRFGSASGGNELVAAADADPADGECPHDDHHPERHVDDGQAQIRAGLFQIAGAAEPLAGAWRASPATPPHPTRRAPTLCWRRRSRSSRRPPLAERRSRTPSWSWPACGGLRRDGAGPVADERRVRGGQDDHAGPASANRMARLGQPSGPRPEETSIRRGIRRRRRAAGGLQSRPGTALTQMGPITTATGRLPGIRLSKLTRINVTGIDLTRGARERRAPDRHLHRDRPRRAARRRRRAGAGLHPTAVVLGAVGLPWAPGAAFR